MVACLVVTYFPDEKVVDKIKDYAEIFDFVYVVDNTDKKEKKDTFNKKINRLGQANKKIIYMSDNKNNGLPLAYNRVIDKLSPDVNYLCTLDQDSYFPKRQIESILNILKYIDNDVCIIAPQVKYDVMQKVCCSTRDIEEKKYVIASGSFLNMKIVRKEKLTYDVNYFIDRFDVDMCYTVREKGYRIIQFNQASISHSLGVNNNGHSDHSVLRHYYIFRNRFYFNKKHFSPPFSHLLSGLQTVKHLVEILIYEKQKFAKFSQLIPAYNDYKNNHFGEK